MKKAGLCIALCTLAFSTAVVAQDAVKTAPNNTKVVLENERVRVYDFWGKAGDKLVTHSHPDHVVYVSGSGKVTENDMKAGQALWVPATTHSVDIVSGDVRAVVVELKK